MTVDLHQLEKDLKFLADSMAERYKKAQDDYTAVRIVASELVKKAEKKASAFVEEAEMTRDRAAEDTAQADRALASIHSLRTRLEEDQP